MYRVVVGIEVHVQIKTKTKAFKIAIPPFLLMQS